MNFWKQSNHVMSYFKEENFRGDHRLPSSFMSGFLEVRSTLFCPPHSPVRVTSTDLQPGSQLKMGYQERTPCRYQIEFPEPPSNTFLSMCHFYLHAINANPCSFSEISPRVRRRQAPTTRSKLVEQSWLAVGLQLLLGGCRYLRNRLPCVPELLGDNITHILEVLESLLEGIDGGGALCAPLLAMIRVAIAVNCTHTVGLDSHVHLGF